MGPEQLLLLHNLRHVELLVELEDHARAVRATRKARAERIRALRQAADGAVESLRQTAGVLTGHPRTAARATDVCDGACAPA
jgi:hypothetical protein